MSGTADGPVPTFTMVQASPLRWLGTRSLESLRTPHTNRGWKLGRPARYVNSFTHKLLTCTNADVNARIGGSGTSQEASATRGWHDPHLGSQEPVKSRSAVTDDMSVRPIRPHGRRRRTRTVTRAS